MGAGRPPKRIDEHLERLEGPVELKQRLEVILDTIAGRRSVIEACELLDIGEARFHELRSQVLASALEGLTPGAPGRPRREEDAPESRVAELEREVQTLRIQLQAARVRTEIALTMPELLRRQEVRASKKNEKRAKTKRKKR
jgi:hypothetical protein